MKTQEEKVIQVLLNQGYVSRNVFLGERITRLGAIVNRLNKNGWDIRGEYVKVGGGKDYWYFLKDSPYKRVVYTVPSLGKKIIRYERK